MTDKEDVMDKLKPCPFCGSEAAVIIALSPMQFKVFCDEGSCSVMTSIWGGKQPAIAAWNRRPDNGERAVMKGKLEAIAWIVKVAVPNAKAWDKIGRLAALTEQEKGR